MSGPYDASDFAAILQDRLGTIDHALAQIKRGELVEAALHSLRGALIEVLEQIERDPGIEAAADDLFTAAATLSTYSARGVPPEARQRRVLSDASSRLNERLASARPASGQVEG